MGGVDGGMTMKKWLLIAVVMQVNTGCVFAGLPIAKVTYHVVDQLGNPVEGASVMRLY